MTQESIRIYCRLRPSIVNHTVDYVINNDSSGKTNQLSEIDFEAPEDYIASHTLHTDHLYKYEFNKVFEEDCEQEEVYYEVAKPVIEKALEGFNSTVFVYGQTATGKTHTILGEGTDFKEIAVKSRAKSPSSKSPHHHLEAIEEADEDDRTTGNVSRVRSLVANAQTISPVLRKEGVYNNLEATDLEETFASIATASDYGVIDLPPHYGIIPRAISQVFNAVNASDKEITVEISYMEIYRETAFDLLSGKRGKKLIMNKEDLNIVKAMTDRRKRLHLRNLSSHVVADEIETLNLLHRGNQNRIIAETHYNDASSRSHCIFTMALKIRHPESKSIVRSKINLVDLAGSERIDKSHHKDRKLINEARNINLSLHHLQQVIIALSSQKIGKHVPYRNSMITTVLRDSLGGNSFTSMIATVSAERRNLEETISTCRFSQRVAEIENKVIMNETLDQDLLIAKLQQELQEARRQMLKSSASGKDIQLTIEMEENLKKMIQNYLDNVLDKISVGSDQNKIQYCFENLKDRILNLTQGSERPPITTSAQSATQTPNKKSKSCTIL